METRIKELSLLELQDLHDQLVIKCDDAEEALLEADNNFRCLEDVKKIKFEQIVEKQVGDKTNYKEHLATISQEWEEFIKTYQRFRYEKNKAELLCKKYDRAIRACIMRSSALKQEMNTFYTGGNR